MREDDERRTWLTESIESLHARECMERARNLQRKSLTSGATDADAAPRQTAGRKGGGNKVKAKVRGQAKVNGKHREKGKQDAIGDISSTPKSTGICYM